jgi:hypothetical protein
VKCPIGFTEKGGRCVKLYRFQGRPSVGDRVVGTMGVDEGKFGRVVEPFPWREESGAYQPPKKGDIPIQFDNGRKRWMHPVHIMQPGT